MVLQHEYYEYKQLQMDESKLACLKDVMDSCEGPIEGGCMILDQEKIFDVINEVLTCLGSPGLNFSPILQCAANCNQPDITDRMNCLQNCMPQTGIAPSELHQCLDGCKTKTNITDRVSCIKNCVKR